MEYWEQASPISSHTYDHARTANALPMTKYRTATYTLPHTYDFSPGGYRLSDQTASAYCDYLCQNS